MIPSSGRFSLGAEFMTGGQDSGYVRTIFYQSVMIIKTDSLKVIRNYNGDSVVKGDFLSNVFDDLVRQLDVNLGGLSHHLTSNTSAIIAVFVLLAVTALAAGYVVIRDLQRDKKALKLAKHKPYEEKDGRYPPLPFTLGNVRLNNNPLAHVNPNIRIEAQPGDNPNNEV